MRTLLTRYDLHPVAELDGRTPLYDEYVVDVLICGLPDTEDGPGVAGMPGRGRPRTDLCARRGCDNMYVRVVGGLGYCSRGHVPSNLTGLWDLPSTDPRIALSDPQVNPESYGLAGLAPSTDRS